MTHGVNGLSLTLGPQLEILGVNVRQDTTSPEESLNILELASLLDDGRDEGLESWERFEKIIPFLLIVSSATVDNGIAKFLAVFTLGLGDRFKGLVEPSG